MLLLRRGQKERQPLAGLRVKSILPKALDKGADRHDVGRLPRGEAARELIVVEIQRQPVSQALIRRDDGDARRVAFGEAREKLRVVEHLLAASLDYRAGGTAMRKFIRYLGPFFLLVAGVAAAQDYPAREI